MSVTIHHSVSILHTLQMLVRQHGGECHHFNGYMGPRDAACASVQGDVRTYTLRGDPARKIWLNGEHVASVIRW